MLIKKYRNRGEKNPANSILTYREARFNLIKKYGQEI